MFLLDTCLFFFSSLKQIHPILWDAFEKVCSTRNAHCSQTVAQNTEISQMKPNDNVMCWNWLMKQSPQTLS